MHLAEPVFLLRNLIFGAQFKKVLFFFEVKTTILIQSIQIKDNGKIPQEESEYGSGTTFIINLPINTN